MPRIFDNISETLLPALRETLGLCERADFCVGYFNLRGWRQLHDNIEKWHGGEGHCCRLMVGMQQMPQDQLRHVMSPTASGEQIDQATAIALKKKLAQEFRDQLTVGIPTNADEAGLRRLAAQIAAGKVVVKLFLRHPLHAKLYLLFRQDPLNPKIGYLGSSNLTMAGLSRQGELNVDVLEHDACDKLAKWFEDRWNDRFCVDISEELIEIINSSWARPEPLPPYHIYVKMAYHLSQEARAGLTEFRIPSDFGNKLFEFQKAAVKIAAHHLNKRGGVVIGDVVGLGKTLMATTLARIFEDDHGVETLIICPRNLVPMWEDYRQEYRLRAKVLSITRVQRELPDLRRFRLVLIDESHNLRNREGRRYRAIAEYIAANDSRVILLSATPYNKTYLDLSNQLRLFIDDREDIGIRPGKLLRELGETEFIRRHQCPVRSLAAFEKSEHADDWRDLMRLYLVRRTRSFIQDNYAKLDPERGRKYLDFADGTRSYFPSRVPKTVRFKISGKDPEDQYARLFADDVVEAVNQLTLPRYGLGNYQQPTPHKPPTPDEARVLADLSRAGSRLKGFCRTNLFKRLESSGHAFILSLERHILRNFICLHAIENGLPLPIGTQDMGLLDASANDEDSDLWDPASDNDDNGSERDPLSAVRHLPTEADIRARAAEVYASYASHFQRRFKWLKPGLFNSDLAEDLRNDAKALLKVLENAGGWDSARDAKLQALLDLLTRQHPSEKVLLFSQFADTVNYLNEQLKARGIKAVEGVTGNSDDPTSIAYRFSPVSNDKRSHVPRDKELRVVLATDVLSEGQNLQDCSVVVNFDLPWAIIRLIQRAGRVDRIGQQSDTILCYSFLPADGVERIIRLRSRVSQRLQENAEVVGADEAFFEDQNDAQAVRDLFTEKAGILDGDEDAEVDLASYAYQIWKNAIDRDRELEKTIPAMPNVVYSTKPWPTAIVDEPSRLVSPITTRRDASSTISNYFDPAEPIGNLSGNLPHWRQQGATYFVTFRLADSLPQEKLKQWLAEREEWLATHPEPHDEAVRAEYYRLFPERLQNWLDAGYGSCVLAVPAIKRIVEQSLSHFDHERYRLIESIVMPNHVHVVVAPLGEYTLSDILHSWKSFTAHEIVKVDEASRLVPKRQRTSRDGSSTIINRVWQQESFDHIVRNAAQLDRIRQYIRDNPKNVDEPSRLVESTRRDAPSTVTSRDGSSTMPEGALVYLRTAEGNDALAWVDKRGNSVTESQFTILKAAECEPGTPAIPRHDDHHEMVANGVKLIVETEKSVGGQLGRPSGARFRTYERLKAYAEEVKGTLFDLPELRHAIEDIYKFPLLQSATDTLNRQLKSGIGNQALAELVTSLRADARLCRVTEDVDGTEPQVICSLGLKKDEGGRMKDE
jgi:superfamily II DNA or RNA helicase/REP element-mobilizing transposase RayT